MNLNQLSDSAAKLLTEEMRKLIWSKRGCPYVFDIYRANSPIRSNVFRMTLSVGDKHEDLISEGYIEFLGFFQDMMMARVGVRIQSGDEYWRAEDVIVEATARAILPRLEMNADMNKIVRQVSES